MCARACQHLTAGAPQSQGPRLALSVSVLSMGDVGKGTSIFILGEVTIFKQAFASASEGVHNGSTL